MINAPGKRFGSEWADGGTDVDDHGPRGGEPGVWAHRRRQACGGFHMYGKQGNPNPDTNPKLCSNSARELTWDGFLKVHIFYVKVTFPIQVDVILEGVENDDWEDIAVNVEVFFFENFWINLTILSFSFFISYQNSISLYQDGQSFIYVSDTGDNDHDK